MKNAVFWDVTSCGSCTDRHFGGMYRLHHQDEENQRATNNFSILLVTASVHSSLFLFTLMMEAIRSSET
jgi:hypothetical protein